MPGEIVGATTNVDNLKTAVVIAGGIGALGIGNKFLRPYVKVPQGHEAVRLRAGVPSTYKFGKKKGMKKVLPPGPHLQIPFSHAIEEVSVKENVTRLPTNRIDLRDKTQQDVNPEITWRIIPSGSQRRHWLRPWRNQFSRNQGNDLLTRTLFDAVNVEDMVASIGGDGLRRATEGAQDDRYRDSDYLTDQVQEQCNPRLRAYGAEIIRITMAGNSQGAPDRLGSYFVSGGWPEDPQAAGQAVVAAELSGGFGTPKLHLIRDEPAPDTPA